MARTLLPCRWFLLALAGCAPIDNPFASKAPSPPPRAGTKLVPTNPFDNSPPSSAITRASYNRASLDASARVDTLGRQVVEANPQAGVKPVFFVIGAPIANGGVVPAGATAVGVFHHGTDQIMITENLVRQCKTDGELAAVLCHELGKMVAEREALAAVQQQPVDRPPMDVPIGNDSAGSFGPPDQTHLAELAKFRRERPRPSPVPPRPLDPDQLAVLYLEKAGYTRADLEAVKPLLQQAAENPTFGRLPPG